MPSDDAEEFFDNKLNNDDQDDFVMVEKPAF